MAFSPDETDTLLQEAPQEDPRLGRLRKSLQARQNPQGDPRLLKLRESLAAKAKQPAVPQVAQTLPPGPPVKPPTLPKLDPFATDRPPTALESRARAPELLAKTTPQAPPEAVAARPVPPPKPVAAPSRPGEERPPTGAELRARAPALIQKTTPPADLPSDVLKPAPPMATDQRIVRGHPEHTGVAATAWNVFVDNLMLPKKYLDGPEGEEQALSHMDPNVAGSPVATAALGTAAAAGRIGHEAALAEIIGPLAGKFSGLLTRFGPKIAAAEMVTPIADLIVKKTGVDAARAGWVAGKVAGGLEGAMQGAGPAATFGIMHDILEGDHTTPGSVAAWGVGGAVLHGLLVADGAPGFSLAKGLAAPSDIAGLTTDPYAILGVTPEATPAEINAAAKRRSSAYHPDVNKAPGSEDIFKTFQEARAEALKRAGAGRAQPVEPEESGGVRKTPSETGENRTAPAAAPPTEPVSAAPDGDLQPASELSIAEQRAQAEVHKLVRDLHEAGRPIPDPDELVRLYHEKVLAWNGELAIKPEPKMPERAASPREAVPENPEKRGTAGTVASIDPRRLRVDPARFQYKESHPETGVTGAIADVKAWKPERAGLIAVWHDPAEPPDADPWIVNGHQRRQKAIELGVPAVNTIEIQAKDAAEARLFGALINIGEGSGTALDAAKILRETGMDREKLREAGVPLTGKIAKDGMALAQLHEGLFDMVARGKLPIERAAVIGRSGLDPDQQMKLHKLLEQPKNKGLTNVEIEELARFVKSAPVVQTSQETLFGTDTQAESLAIDKAKTSAWLMGRLGKQARAFKFNSDAERAGFMEEGGVGKIDTAKAGQLGTEAEQVLEVYRRLSASSGPVSDALNQAVKQIRGGTNEQVVRAQLLKSVKAAVQEVLTGAGGEGGGGREASPEGGARADEGPGLALGEEKAEYEVGKKEPALRFYSRLTRAIEKAPFKTAPASQWLGYLKNQSLSKAENEWVGLHSALQDMVRDDGDPKITGAEILAMEGPRKIAVTETVLGAGDAEVPQDLLDERDRAVEDHSQATHEWQSALDGLKIAMRDAGYDEEEIRTGRMLGSMPPGPSGPTRATLTNARAQLGALVHMDEDDLGYDHTSQAVNALMSEPRWEQSWPELSDRVKEAVKVARDARRAHEVAQTQPPPPEVEEAVNRVKVTEAAQRKTERERDRANAAVSKAGESKRPKFSQYTEPGGENYREILVQLGGDAEAEATAKAEREKLTELPDDYEPITDGNKSADHRWGVVRKDAVSARPMAGSWPTKEIAIERALHLLNEERLAKALNEASKGQFREGHFSDHPDVMVTLRVKDYSWLNPKTGKREKVIFNNEFQDDWAQMGRKYGFAGEKRTFYEIRVNGDLFASRPTREAAERFIESTKAQAPEGGYFANREYTIEEKTEDRQDAVPNRPFKKTEEWAELGIKRLLAEAAEKGADRVAWSNGDQAVRRYPDLRKYVERISFNPESKSIVAHDSHGNVVLTKTGVTPENLADFVGKGPAERLLALSAEHGATADAGVEQARAQHAEIIEAKRAAQRAGDTAEMERRSGRGAVFIEGDDLAIGGEGMIDFYDKIIPNVAKKYLKSLGGTVEPIEMRFGMDDERAADGPTRAEMQDHASEYATDAEEDEKALLDDWAENGVPDRAHLSEQDALVWDGLHDFVWGPEGAPGAFDADAANEQGDEGDPRDRMMAAIDGFIRDDSGIAIDEMQELQTWSANRVPRREETDFTELWDKLEEYADENGHPPGWDAIEADAIAGARDANKKTVLSIPMTPELRSKILGEGQRLMEKGPEYGAKKKKPKPTRLERAKAMGFDTDTEVYHGTTHDFDEFSAHLGNPENHYGKAYYFTDSPDDASRNYAGEGPDLTSRIEQRVDRMTGTDESAELSDEEIRAKARAEIVGPHEGAVIPAFLKIKNPVIVTPDGGTRFEIIDERNEDGDVLDQSGNGLEIADAFRQAANQFDSADGQKLSDEIIQAIYEQDGITATELENLVRESENAMYANMDETGEMAVGELVRRAYEIAGFDGIVQDAGAAFGSGRKFGQPMMGADYTTHYIVFHPNQIRSTFAKFDPKKADSGDILAEGNSGYNLFGEKEPEQTKQGELLPGGPQGVSAALDQARATVSKLQGKMDRGVASPNEKTRYAEAQSLIRREEGKGLGAGEVKPIEGAQEPAGEKPLDLFGSVRERQRNMKEQFSLTFGSVPKAMKVAKEIVEIAGPLAQVSIPGVVRAEDRIAAVKQGRQAAYAWVPATGHVLAKANGEIDKVSVFRLLKAYRHPGAEYFHLMVAVPDVGGFRIVHHHLTSTGSLDMALVNQGDVLQAATIAKKLGGKVIRGHNHPSGIPKPSTDDRTADREIQATLNRVGAEDGGHYVINHEDAVLLDSLDEESDVPIHLAAEPGAQDWTNPDAPFTRSPEDVFRYLANFPMDENRVDVLMLTTQHQIAAWAAKPLSEVGKIGEWLPELRRNTSTAKVVIGVHGPDALARVRDAINGLPLGILDVLDSSRRISLAEQGFTGFGGHGGTGTNIFAGGAGGAEAEALDAGRSGQPRGLREGRAPGGERGRVQEAEGTRGAGAARAEVSRLGEPPASFGGPTKGPGTGGSAGSADDIKAILRNTFATRAHRNDIAAAELETAVAEWEKPAAKAEAGQKAAQAEIVDFIDAIEHGATANLPPKQKAAAATVRSVLDKLSNELRTRGLLDTFRQDYFGRIWRDPDEKVLGRIFGKRPLRGPRGFKKKRSYDFFREGYDAGLQPIDWNPFAMELHKIAEMNKAIAAHDLVQELKARGMIHHEPGRVPDGYQRISDDAFTVYQRGPNGETILRGHWVAPTEVAQVLNRYLTPSPIGNLGFVKALRFVNNALNQIQLLGLFHAGFVSVDSVLSRIGIGMVRAFDGAKSIGTGNIGVGAGEIAHGLKQALSAPAAPALQAYRGNKLMQAWRSDPALLPAGARELIEAIERGGGRGGADARFHTQAVKSFKRALSEGTPKGMLKAVGWATPAAAQAVTAPILEWFVPRVKLAAFADMARYELEKLPGGPLMADPMEQRRVLQDAWRSVDERLGQVVYDNLFWDPTVKEAAHLAFRSVGWSWGSLSLGAKGVAQAPLIFKGKLTHSTAYLFALVLGIGTADALIQYLMTGEKPKDLKDLAYPRTGHMMPDGTEERLALPSYIKDFYSWGTHPLATAGHKLSPMLSVIAEAWQNEDFYGTQIVDPDSPWTEQMKQLGAYAARTATPLSVRSIQQFTSAQEGGAGPAAIVGVAAAPASVRRSKFQGFVADRFAESLPRGARKPDQVAASKREGEATTMLRRADSQKLTDQQRRDLLDKSGYSDLTPAQRTRVLSRSKIETDEYRFQRLPLELQIKAYNLADDDERKDNNLLKHIFSGTLPLRLKNLTPDARATVEKELDAIRSGQQARGLTVPTAPPPGARRDRGTASRSRMR